MQRFKKQFAFLFGMIALVTYVSVRYFPSEQETTQVIQMEDTSTHMQVYLLDSDQTLVPISIPVDEEYSTEDKLHLMMGYLSGKQQIKGFYPLFTKETDFSQIEISGGKAVLHVDDQFTSYDSQLELRILESIIWGTTQFHDIEQVNLVNKQGVMTQMPNASTPIPEICNRSIGINHFETGTTSLHNSNEMVVYYAKKVEGNTYMIPKTKRYASTRTSIESRVNEIIEDIAVSSTLSSPFKKEQVSIQRMDFQNGVIKVSLDEHILGADKSVKQDVYDSFMLSLLSLSDVKQAQILVDDVVVSISEHSEPVALQDITYNVIKF